MDATTFEHVEQRGWDLGAREQEVAQGARALQEAGRAQRLEVAVADERDVGPFAPQQVGGPQRVRRTEDQAGADAVRGVHRAADAGVVDDRDEVGDPGVGGEAEALGVGPGVVPVLRVPARDQLRDAGGPARELEHGEVVGTDAVLHLRDDVTRLLRVERLPQRLEDHGALGGGTDVAPDGQHVAQGRVTGGLLPGEGDEVEAGQATLDDVGDGTGLAADLADLVAPVGGQGRDRDEPGLEQRVPRDDGLEPVAELQQHPVTGCET